MRHELSFETIVMTAIAFGMGLARNIVSPDRRGLLGFTSAILVAVICGAFAGFIASELGVVSPWQFVLTAVFAIFGDRMMFAALQMTLPKSTTINNNTTIGDGAKIDTFQTGDKAHRE